MGEEQGQKSVQSSAGKPRLQQAIEFISPLISHSHSVKVFLVKWHSIRNKLEEILSNLTVIDQNSDFHDNESILNTVEAILATLKNCNELAQRCVDLSYTGKLLMKSDLDIVCTKLDNHIKTLSDVYTLGLLTHRNALVVPKPGISASRDDVRFYINDLFSRLRIGSWDMKKQALVAFNDAIEEDDRYVKISVEVDGFISFLVHFLDSEEGEVQEQAVKAVCVISGFEYCKGVLISVGIISPLIRVLESGGGSSKEFAARCLMKFTENSNNAWSVSAHGGVSALLKICGKRDNGGELVGLACGVLKNFVGVEEIKRFMVEEGAIPLILNHVRSRDEITRICSLDLLQAMAYKDESVSEMVVKEGGISTMVHILDPKSSFSMKIREVSLRGIMNICCSSENSLNILIASNFMDHILYFLRFGEASVQELALKAVFWLCGTSEETKKFMGDAGFMPVVVKFLDSKSFEIREVAAEILYSMVIIPRNRKSFVQNDQNVGLILQKLDPEGAGEANSSNNKRLLLSILMSLTSSNSARKKILNSGYLKNVEKLADAEVSDAKKIVRKLSCNRFRSILSGFWHS